MPEESTQQVNVEVAEEMRELRESIEDLEDSIRTTNSNKRVILRGILSGLSGIIGATIIFGIVIALLSSILYKTGLFPELNTFLNNVTNKK